MNLHFLDKRPICKNCKFCEFLMYEDKSNSYQYTNYKCICHLMPTPVKKSPLDWCGQYEERGYDLDYMLSFNEEIRQDLDYMLSFDKDIILGKWRK